MYLELCINRQGAQLSPAITRSHTSIPDRCLPGCHHKFLLVAPGPWCLVTVALDTNTPLELALVLKGTQLLFLPTLAVAP